MIKNILGVDLKYEDNKLYRLDNRNKKWSCCNDNTPNNKGYIVFAINKKRYYLHRIIYKYHIEEWDITDTSRDNQIDHININPLDNRIENLRIVNHSQNNRNRNKFKNCSSQYKGVSWHKQNNKWIAHINIDNKFKYLGSFTNEEEAYECYKKVYDEIMDF